MLLNKMWVRFTYLPIVTLVCTPWFTYEPFDNSKLLFLGISAALAIMQLSKIELGLKNPKSLTVIVSGSFVVAMLIPIFLSGAPFAQQLYGAAGRSLGFLHYLFLFCVFLGVCCSKNELRFDYFVKALIATGVFESIYAGIQYMNLDPIGWDNSSRWIFGTFGNPNFLSAFLGMSACGSLFVRQLNLEKAWRLTGYLNFIFCVTVILLSNSVQGLFIVFLGIYVALQVILFHISRILSFLFLCISFTGALVVSVGVFGKGPISGFIYQESTAFRGDYWRAGWQMFENNILSGVGLDSYGDNYRRYRDLVAANRRGLDIYSTSAHNIYIDLAATGGIFLLGTFILFSSLISYLMVVNLRRSKFKNPENVLLAILWIGFQLQLIISINVSSVAIWGFAVAGLIVYKSRASETRPSDSLVVKGKKPVRVHSVLSLRMISILFINVSLVAPLLLRDVQLANAITAASSIRLQQVATSWPQSCLYLAKTEEALSDVEYFSDSLSVSEKSVSLNPKCFDSWRHIYENPSASNVKKEGAWKKMLELDPNLNQS